MKKALTILAVFCFLRLDALPPIQTDIPGCVGWWTLNEGSGSTAYDYSGSGFNGTITGSLTWTNGAVGDALEGFTDFAYVTISNSIVPTQTNFTVSAWVYPTSISTAYSSIVDSQNLGNGGGWGLEVNNTKNAYIAVNGGFCETTITLANNQWYHILGEVAYSASTYTFSIFVDGTNASAAGGVTATTWTTNAITRIGQATKIAENPFPGVIDDVRVYNRALTTNEIQALYGGGYGKAGP